MIIDTATDSLSYWHATAEPMLPEDDLPSSAEVVVIGGGMLGVWTAYWLAKAGVPVVVLEQSAIGWGATGRNGGFLVGGAGVGYTRLIELLGRDNAALLYAMTIAGQELGHDIVAEESIECDIRRTGTLFLARSEGALTAVEQQHQLLAKDGFDSAVLDRQSVQALIATPLGEEIVGGSLAPQGMTLHSSRYLAGLALAAQRHGAKFVRARATSIKHHADGATVHTDIGNIDTGRVMVALNAWTDTLIHEMQGVIRPVRGQILAYTPIDRVFHTAVGTDVTPTQEYWQQMPDGSIIIGGCRADAPNADVNVRDQVPTPEVIAKIEHVLPNLFPGLNYLNVARSWAGLMAFTNDGLPVVDHSTESNAIWYGGGFNGHGMPFGPILGKLVANAMINGDVAPDLKILGHKRPSL